MLENPQYDVSGPQGKSQITHHLCNDTKVPSPAHLGWCLVHLQKLVCDGKPTMAEKQWPLLLGRLNFRNILLEFLVVFVLVLAPVELGNLLVPEVLLDLLKISVALVAVLAPVVLGDLHKILVALVAVLAPVEPSNDLGAHVVGVVVVLAHVELAPFVLVG